MGIGQRWIVECDADGCAAWLGPFATEREARDDVKYSENADGWQVTEQDWAFGVSLHTYCPEHCDTDTPDSR